MEFLDNIYMEHFWIIYSWKLLFSLIIYYMEFLDIVAWIFSISWNTIGLLWIILGYNCMDNLYIMEYYWNTFGLSYMEILDYTLYWVTVY